MIQKRNAFLAPVTLLFVVVGCQSNEFGGSTGKKPPVRTADKVAANCSEGQEKVEVERQITVNRSGGDLTVTGTLCRAIREIPVPDTFVHFILDRSASMRDIDPDPANCNRFVAARRFFDGITENFGANIHQVKVSASWFASESGVISAPIPAEQFRARFLDPKTFCEYRRGEDGGTNYQAAYLDAARMMDQLPPSTQKQVIHITDGAPSVSNSISCGGTNANSDCVRGVMNEGAEAARQVIGIQGVNLGIFFLKNDQSETRYPGGLTEVEVTDYVNQLAPGRVVFPGNASEAAKEMEVFVPPPPPKVSGQPVGLVSIQRPTSSNTESREVPLTQLNDQTWRYELTVPISFEDEGIVAVRVRAADKSTRGAQAFGPESITKIRVQADETYTGTEN